MLAAGHHVTGFVRNPDSPAAKALVEQGVALAVGDLDDQASLEAATQGQDAVFSVQMPGVNPADPGSEERQARNLATAAKQAGVTHLVHTSVSAAGWRDQHPEITEIDPLMKDYWDQKEAAEQVVRDSGIEHWTIFRPALYMEDFLLPRLNVQFPKLLEGKLLLGAPIDTPMAMICAEDLGAGVAAAIADPERFDGAQIELAGDVRTWKEIAETISAASGKDVQAAQVSSEDRAEKLGAPSAWGHQWDDRVGYPARPELAEEFGLQMTTFDQWARRQDWSIISA
ncbi:NAD(P)H-binding protein [Luteococcus sediminum]